VLETSKCSRSDNVYIWPYLINGTSISVEAIGLNPLFNHREQEQVHHDPELQKKLPKGEQPDAVYGLRQTRNFEDLLYDTAAHGDGNAQVHELLNPSPMKEDGEPLLFPFIVLEAKSSTSPSDWHSVKMQTAFPIKTFLDTQNKLRISNGRSSKWRSGPLVWFFLNRGEEWKLCVAYMQDAPPKPRTVGDVEYVIYLDFSIFLPTRLSWMN